MAILSQIDQELNQLVFLTNSQFFFEVLLKFLTCPYILISFWRSVMHALFLLVQVESDNTQRQRIA